MLALIAALSSSTLVVQQWVWSGQRPHKTLNYEKALLVINNKKEILDKRHAASIYLYELVLDGIAALKGYEKMTTAEFKKDIVNVRRNISKSALGK